MQRCFNLKVIFSFSKVQALLQISLTKVLSSFIPVNYLAFSSKRCWKKNVIVPYTEISLRLFFPFSTIGLFHDLLVSFSHYVPKSLLSYSMQSRVRACCVMTCGSNLFPVCFYIPPKISDWHKILMALVV